MLTFLVTNCTCPLHIKRLPIAGMCKIQFARNNNLYLIHNLHYDYKLYIAPSSGKPFGSSEDLNIELLKVHVHHNYHMECYNYARVRGNNKPQNNLTSLLYSGPVFIAQERTQFSIFKTHLS